MKKFCIVLLGLLLLASCDSESATNSSNSGSSTRNNPIEAPIIELTTECTSDGKNIISITSKTPGCEIYYTLDDKVPTRETAYKYKSNQKVQVNSEVTVRAIAVKEGMPASEVSTASFKQVKTPDFYYINPGKLKLSSMDSSLKYYYTTSDILNPKEMTECSEVFLPKGIGDISVKVVACKAGYINSERKVKEFSVCDAPVITIIGNSYNNRKYVNFSFDTNSKFYYTTSDFEPTIGDSETFQILQPGIQEFSKRTLIVAQCQEDGKLLSDLTKCYLYSDSQ